MKITNKPPKTIPAPIFDIGSILSNNDNAAQATNIPINMVNLCVLSILIKELLGKVQI